MLGRTGIGVASIILLVGSAFARLVLFNDAGDDPVFAALLVSLIFGQTLLLAGLVVWACLGNRSDKTAPGSNWTISG
jgi:hypothetical protein